jgi:hypothetical protein
MPHERPPVNDDKHLRAAQYAFAQCEDVKSFVDDLSLGQGVVLSRAASTLRSIERVRGLMNMKIFVDTGLSIFFVFVWVVSLSATRDLTPVECFECTFVVFLCKISGYFNKVCNVQPLLFIIY